LWALLSECGGKGLLFLSLIYLARMLGVENFGIFSFAHITVTYFWLAVDLGTNMYGVREVAKPTSLPRKTLASLLSMRITSGILVFAIFLSVTEIFIKSEVQRKVFLAFSLYLISRSIYTEWFLRGLEKFKYVAIGNLCTFGFFLLSILFLVKSKDHVAMSSLFFSLSFLSGGLIFLLLTRKSLNGLRIKLVYSIRDWVYHLRESIHFTFSNGLAILYQQLPLFFLGIFSSNYDLGLYSAAQRAIFAIVFVFSVYPMAIYPILSDLCKRNPPMFFKLFNISAMLMALAAFLSAFCLFIYSNKLCLIIYGHDYIEAGYIIRILAGFFFLRSIREVFAIGLGSAGLQRCYTLASGFGVIFIIMALSIMSFWFDCKYIFSAPMALLITELGVVVIMLWAWTTRQRGGPLSHSISTLTT
jgi:PST family polysaccharide transporter